MPSTPSPTKSGCGCIAKLDEALKERGQRIRATMFALPPRVILPLERIDTGEIDRRKGRSTHILVSHCPFCGAAYPPATEQVL